MLSRYSITSINEPNYRSMSRTFSEDAIVEQPVMDILCQDLAWEGANVYEGETFELLEQ